MWLNFIRVSNNCFFKYVVLKMNVVKQIKGLIKEAEIYNSQGLYFEAQDKYENAVNLFNKSEQLKKNHILLNAILQKISTLKKKIRMVESNEVHTEISNKTQNLIKRLFSFSSNESQEMAELEGAIALAKFGQFERALKEFMELVNFDATRVVAAKNVLKCQIALFSLDAAVVQFQQWLAIDIFSSDQLKKIRLFLQNMLDKKGFNITLPEIRDDESIDKIEINQSQGQDDLEDVLDINSIRIAFDSGSHKGAMVEYDVSFQSGNMLSLIFSKKDKELINSISVGHKLENIQYYSPIAMFTGSGLIFSKTEIKSGPKKGDYCLDIKIIS